MPEEVKVATVSVPVAAGTLVEPGTIAAVGAAHAKDKTLNIAEGAAAAKKAFEEGQIPGNRGLAHDGKPSPEDQSAANTRIREAGLAAVHDRQAISEKQNVESHKRMESVIATTPEARLGFNPNDHGVKYVGEDAKYIAQTGKAPVGAVAPVALAPKPAPVAVAPVVPVVNP